MIAESSSAIESTVKQERRQHMGVLLRSPVFRIGVAMLLPCLACAIFGTLICPYSPLAQDLLNTNAHPSGTHWFGTDSLGRDIGSRVIGGSREILMIAPAASVLGIFVGSVIGLVQGYYRGWLDMIVGRIVEAFLALPLVIMAFLFIVAAGPSPLTLILVIGFSFALLSSRTVRTAVLQERGLDYVAAARLRGESPRHTMFVEILPNVMGTVIVEFSLRLGYAVFTVATLSFLGFGVRPPTPDWGADIAANSQYLAAGYWWETLFPALAIALLITAINLIADSIESVLTQ